jgi:hypothetical protein
VNTTHIAKISAHTKNGSKTNTSQENNKCEKILNLQRGAVISMQNTIGRCNRIIQLNECMKINSDIPPGALFNKK